MKDSQQQPKKRMFLRKKESKNAPAKAQKPQRVRKAAKKEEKVIFEKENPIQVEEQVVEQPVPEEVKVEEVKEEATENKKEKKVLSGINSQFSVFRKKLTSVRLPKPKSRKSVDQKPKTENKKPKADPLYKQIETDLQLALIPLILLAVLASLMLLNNHYLKLAKDNSLPQVESVAAIQPFPLAENVIPPDISAKAAIVTDADSQVILVNKNAEVRFSMASTTKIMTAITALDHFKDDDVLTVKTGGVDGSVIGLQRGEQLTFIDLLYAMMLPSANDAAVVIADNYPGGREAFVNKMNEKAQSLYLANTHFADPTGLDDDENFTTAVDLARLSAYAMRNKTFAEVVGTQEKLIYNTYYSKQYSLSNLNRLLGTNGVNGIKTGTTEGAGEVLVTSTVKNGHTYIIVVMNSTNRFADTKELLTFIDEKVKYVMPPLPGK